MFILETLNFVVDILKSALGGGVNCADWSGGARKKRSDVVKGTIKTILGFIVSGWRWRNRMHCWV